MSNTISSTTEKTVIKGLKFRIYPTQEQIQLIEKTFGCCRQIYNNRIDEKTEFYIENILPVKNKTTKDEKTEIYKTFKPSTEKEMKQKFPYMKEVSDRALQFARQNCEKAYTNFFKSLSGKRVGRKIGFPKYKSKKDSHQSYQEMSKLEHFNFNEKTIKIAKLGKVKFYERQLPKWWKIVEKLGTTTISKSSSGRYYCTLTCHLKHEWLEETPKNRKDSIGLDFSPKNCYVDSDGKSGKDFGYVAQKQTLKHRRKLQKLQKSYNRKLLRPFYEKLGRYPNWKSSKDKVEFKILCKENSFKNLNKTRTKLSKVSEKIANKRMNWIQTETKRLTTTYEKVMIEDLNIQGMMKGFCSAKNYVDVSWETFVSKLEQKGKKYNCKIIKADRFFPSSKLCHCCGYKKEDLTLLDRSWICPKCGTNHNRDHNAAINLKNYIPTQHREFTSVEIEENSETNKEVEKLALLALGAVEETETVLGDNTNITPKSL